MDRMEVCKRMAQVAKRKERRRKPHTHYVDCSGMSMSYGWMRKRKFVKPIGHSTLARCRSWWRRQVKRFGVPYTIMVIETKPQAER